MAEPDWVLLRQLIERLESEEAPPAREQECPICGGILLLTYESYLKRGEAPALGIVVRCETCGKGLCVDLGEPLPKWANAK